MALQTRVAIPANLESLFRDEVETTVEFAAGELGEARRHHLKGVARDPEYLARTRDRLARALALRQLVDVGQESEVPFDTAAQDTLIGCLLRISEELGVGTEAGDLTAIRREFSRFEACLEILEGVDPRAARLA